ncbi:hypothetical protein [Dictyobacter aurantiacus]|uniref:hypothetical protein n=1 Tax=Dictyobacter aurantiacus TaxID=1936993 RepID=UPI000F846B27|nr:hypothetical protein [Dictyobacter aurantiacus]
MTKQRNVHVSSTLAANTFNFSAGNRKHEKLPAKDGRIPSHDHVPVGGIGLRPFQYGISSEKQQSGLVHAALLTYDMLASAWP